MQVKAFIENIDGQHITVSYDDPFGHGEYRTAVEIPDDFKPEDLEALVLKWFPLSYLRQRHRLLTRKIEGMEEFAKAYVGQTLTLTIPEAPDRPVID